MARSQPGRPGVQTKQKKGKSGHAKASHRKGKPSSSAKKVGVAGAPMVRLKYVTSAPDLRHCPEDDKPEVALIGRSNSGKSSLINGMAQERVAQVSSTPGKTRYLNFFDAGESYRFVDMPGYGYSARGGEEHYAWKPMIEGYLGARGNLCGLLILLDVRRDWTEDEAQMVNWLRPRELPSAVVLTKTDKISRRELETRIRKIGLDSGLENVFATSSLKNTGFAALEDFVFKNWIQPHVQRSSHR
jgi:GTP-binding protein